MHKFVTSLFAGAITLSLAITVIAADAPKTGAPEKVTAVKPKREKPIVPVAKKAAKKAVSQTDAHTSQ